MPLPAGLRREPNIPKGKRKEKINFLGVAKRLVHPLKVEAQRFFIVVVFGGRSVPAKKRPRRPRSPAERLVIVRPPAIHSRTIHIPGYCRLIPSVPVAAVALGEAVQGICGLGAVDASGGADGLSLVRARPRV